MKIIFCISNLFIPCTLSLINEARKSLVLVYTDQECIYHFFEVLKLENVFIYYKKEFILKKKISVIIRYFVERKSILRYLETFNFSELFFFHNTFGAREFWIIKKLNCPRKYLIPIFNNLPIKSRFNLFALKGMFSSYLIHGIMVEPLWNGERIILKTKESYFKNLNINKLSIPVNNYYINQLINNTFKFDEKIIILLSGSVVELERVDKTEYIFKLNALIKHFGKDKMLLKPHPRFTNKYGLENKLDSAPYYIPANVLFSKFKIYIGYNSTVLTEAANENLLAISLLNYFHPKSDELKTNTIHYLNINLKEGKQIFYPKDLDDLSLIISKSLNQEIF